MKGSLLAARLEWILAAAARDRPKRQAVLWVCQYLAPDQTFVIDMRRFHGGTLDLPFPLALCDLDDAPPDAVLAVVHPRLRVDMRREYLLGMPIHLGEADRLLAEAIIEMAIQGQPDLRATLGW